MGAAGIKTFEDAAERSAYALETAAQKRTPFGSQLRTTARQILAAALTIRIRAPAEGEVGGGEEGEASGRMVIEITRK